MGANFRLRVKESPCSPHAKVQVKRSALLTGNVSLCMDGARVRGFSRSMREDLLKHNTQGGGHDPSQAEFFYKRKNSCCGQPVENG